MQYKRTADSTIGNMHSRKQLRKQLSPLSQVTRTALSVTDNKQPANITEAQKSEEIHADTSTPPEMCALHLRLHGSTAMTETHLLGLTKKQYSGCRFCLPGEHCTSRTDCGACSHNDMGISQSTGMYLFVPVYGSHCVAEATLLPPLLQGGLQYEVPGNALNIESGHKDSDCTYHLIPVRRRLLPRSHP